MNGNQDFQASNEKEKAGFPCTLGVALVLVVLHQTHSHQP